MHTGLSHTENHTMSSSRPTWCSDRHLIHSHNTPDTSTYERDRMRSRTREDHTSYTFNTLASFSCSRVGTRTALTDTVLSRRTPGQPRVRTRATTSPDWRVDRGGHTYNTHTTIAARHFALAPRTSVPLLAPRVRSARHIIYITSLVLAAPQASCTSLSLRAGEAWQHRIRPCLGMRPHES